MPRIPDNAIEISVSVTMTYTLHRHIDRNDPKRRSTKIVPLHLRAVGSDALNKTLPAELESMAAIIIAEVARWEGKAAKRKEEAPA
jgi:hypothetical protein